MIPRNQGRIRAAQKATLARKHQQVFSRFFRKQGLMVLDRLTLIQHQFTNKAAPLPSNLNDAWNNIWGTISQDTTAELQEIVTAAESDGFLAGGHYEQGKWVKGNKFWDLKNPRAVAWFQKNGGSVDYIKGINDTTSELVKSVIGRGLDEGQSYTQIAKGIRSEFVDMSRARAQRIAVFETGKAYEAGNHEFALSLEDDGITMEEHWMTSHDEKVRPEHAANEAEGWVPMGHVFSSGDTEPPTDPGCRCYMIYRQAGSSE
jgi:SPP1 gp7 family putative phage head morphogenesis protein